MLATVGKTGEGRAGFVLVGTQVLESAFTPVDRKLKDRAAQVFVEHARLAEDAPARCSIDRLRGIGGGGRVRPARRNAGGVHVGDYSAKTRETIREPVLAGFEAGDAVRVWKAPHDQGNDFRTAGRNRRRPVDFDGLKLVSFKPDR
ncbi:ssRNA endonuclease [Rhodobacter capsulatus YW2]|nr:type I-E CRISPR-associated endoribonuclease Cas2e [Rhodobacter capsulatus]ETD91469.1 ssRNA endonuclease [Rhodobacter capsulatus YW2]